MQNNCNKNKYIVRNQQQIKRLIFMALASAMIMPTSAFSADQTINITIPAGGGKPSTTVSCLILVSDGVTFKNTYYTEAVAGIDCEIPKGKPGYETKVTIGLLNNSKMAQNTTYYLADDVIRYDVTSAYKTYVLRGNPPNCVKGTTYSYKTRFKGTITAVASYSGQTGTGTFSLDGASSSFKAASSACSP